MYNLHSYKSTDVHVSHTILQFFLLLPFSISWFPKPKNTFSLCSKAHHRDLERTTIVFNVMLTKDLTRSLLIILRMSTFIYPMKVWPRRLMTCMHTLQLYKMLKLSIIFTHLYKYMYSLTLKQRSMVHSITFVKKIYHMLTTKSYTRRYEYYFWTCTRNSEFS